MGKNEFVTNNDKNKERKLYQVKNVKIVYISRLCLTAPVWGPSMILV